jgi:hypothetical protein
MCDYRRHDCVLKIDLGGLLGLRGFRLGSTPKTAPLQSLFIALYVGPHARRIAVWLIGASADDLERAVVLLDVRVTESHITVGCAAWSLTVTVMVQTSGCARIMPAGIVSD